MKTGYAALSTKAPICARLEGGKKIQRASAPSWHSCAWCTASARFSDSAQSTWSLVPPSCRREAGQLRYCTSLACEVPTYVYGRSRWDNCFLGTADTSYVSMPCKAVRARQQSLISSVPVGWSLQGRQVTPAFDHPSPSRIPPWTWAAQARALRQAFGNMNNARALHSASACSFRVGQVVLLSKQLHAKLQIFSSTLEQRKSLHCALQCRQDQLAL